ncbi:MAG: hypothetical protein ACOCV2_14605 [Persicimonas sp.]
MLDFVVTFAVGLVAVAALAALQSRFDRTERRFIWLGFAAAVLAALAQVWINRYYYGGGDLLNFYNKGTELADWLAADFGGHVVPLLELLFHRTVYIPIRIVGQGGSTGSMFALSGILSFVLAGSLYGICLLLSLFAFSGQLAIYEALRSTFAPRYQKRLLVASFLVPTVVYWSGGLLKETLAVGGLGYLFLATQRLITRGVSARYLVLGALGVLVVGLFKAYILVAFFAAAGAWLYWHRSLHTTGEVAILARPVYLVLGAAVAIGAIIAVGHIFPRFAPETIATELAHVQMHQQSVSGGSTYELPVPQDPTLTAQLALVPIGLIAALFRPFLFEAHNAVALLNALETTAILAMVVWIVFGRGLRDTYRTITGSPAAVFCLVFVLLFATVVGTSSPNLGSLSRYRIPMMPFYVALLLLLVPTSTPRSYSG